MLGAPTHKTKDLLHELSEKAYHNKSIDEPSAEAHGSDLQGGRFPD
jgi:hypothetical protein